MKNILLLLMILLSACITSRKPQMTEGSHLQLESCRWNCVELYGKAVVTAGGVKPPYLYFSKGENVVQGNGGCNAMTGKYAAHDDLLTLHSIAHTERACLDNAINEQESFFFKVLEETERYNIHHKNLVGAKKEMLELYKDKTLIATFEADSLTE
jgi:heat shock protein HslJ